MISLDGHEDMPVSIKRIKNSGALVLEKQCEVCGSPASFGFDVHFRLAMNSLEAGDKLMAKRYLGKWYCREHRPGGGDGLA